MFALLPILGGILAGWLAPRRVAIALQVVFCAVAVAVLTATAPEHGGSYADIGFIAPALAAASVLTLLLGFRLARRRVRTA